MAEIDGVVIVTGASSMKSIGRACALRAAEMGADVVVSDIVRPDDRIGEDERRAGWEGRDAVGAQVEALGRKAVAVNCDITDRAQVDQLVGAAASLGKITGLVNAARALDNLRLEGDEATGISILRRALEEPMRHIGFNAGLDGAVLVEAIRRKASEAKNRNLGYDVIAGEYVDLVKAGVIDPAKVVRTALQNAASVASLLLTTEAMIAEKPKKDAPAPAAGGHGGGGMGGMGGMDF